MVKREKCPHCGQAMPLTKAEKKARLRIDASTIVPSSYVDGALVWIVDGEEGGEIGADAWKTVQSLRATLAAANADAGEAEFSEDDTAWEIGRAHV